MLGLFFLLSNSFASDVILPSFEAAPGTEGAGPEMVYASMIEALSDRDIEFLDADDLRTFIGSKADNCATRVDCPESLWNDIEGELALTGVVSLLGDSISAKVEFHRPGTAGPIEVFEAEFATFEVDRFGVDAALIAEDILRLGDQLGAPVAIAPLPAEPVTVTEDALGPISSNDNTVQDPDPGVLSATESAPTPGRISERSMSPEDERRYMGMSEKLFGEYQASGMGRSEFIGEKRYRARTFFVELSPGVVFGDVQRRYISRAMLLQRGPEDFETQGFYQRDQLIPGTAFAMTAGVGYAPTWWLEFGANLGLEFPKKELVTGWEAYANRSSFETANICPTCSEQRTFQPATAIAFLVEPRLRFVLVPTGAIKPFLVTAWSTRFLDAYETPDLDQVDYPNRPGIQAFGPTGGAGVAVDPRRRASIFVESTVTRLLGPGTMDTGRQFVNQIPVSQEGLGVVSSVRVGVTSRF